MRLSVIGILALLAAGPLSTAAFAQTTTTTAGEHKTVKQKAKGTSGAVVAKSKQGVSKTGEAITDGWITSRVHTKFVGEKLLKHSDINVDTNDHVVTLKGTVPTAAGKRRAVLLAKRVEGVHNVVDELVIGAKR